MGRDRDAEAPLLRNLSVGESDAGGDVAELEVGEATVDVHVNLDRYGPERSSPEAFSYDGIHESQPPPTEEIVANRRVEAFLERQRAVDPPHPLGEKVAADVDGEVSGDRFPRHVPESLLRWGGSQEES